MTNALILRYVTAAMIAAAILAGAATGLMPTAVSVLTIGGGGGALLALASFYTLARPDPRLAATLEGTGLLVILTAAGAFLSYAVAVPALPLQDALFARLDTALGFDWNAFLAFVSASPALTSVLIVAYHSSMAQIIGLVLALGLLGHVARLQRFLVAYALSALVVIGVSGLLPAVGAYVFHAPNPAQSGMTELAGIWHLAHFEALREGRLTVIDLRTMEGIVTFPSFHTVLAVLTAWGAWVLRWARWPMVGLNAVVIVGTLPEGGHYLVDLIAGGAIAVAAIAVVSRLPAERAAPFARVPSPSAPV